MDKIVIEGGRKLSGKVLISGSKNASLPILAATILTSSGWNYFKNVPNLRDIDTMLHLLKGMGIKVRRGRSSVKLLADQLSHYDAPYDVVRTMRASVLVLGPLVARMGHARVSLPGGCAIGERPINYHLKALEAMGAEIKLEGGYVEAHARELRGTRICFEDVTVTGTENILMAATLARGETVLENSAREPEVVDLAETLKKMGAIIEGAGTETIHIQGVDQLRGGAHTVMFDRIEAATFMMAAAMTRGDVWLLGVNGSLLNALIDKLQEIGAEVTVRDGALRIRGRSPVHSADISTKPYPGFVTDFQAQFMALMCLGEGTSGIVENIFENRYMHAAELKRMGADIRVEGNSAVVKGVEKLTGAPVMATDLRASASLILAGLVAEGLTEVHRVYHLDRGYERIEKKLKKLGARIKRVKVRY